MNVFALLLAFFAQSADSQAVADLFDVLDKDGNGRVTASEISMTQQPWFQRALRVSDQNEDGALTREELTAAVADLRPVVVSAQSRNGGRGGNFDLTQLDRNRDGNISKEEVPQPLRERFQAAFDRYGKDSIPVPVLLEMARGQVRTPGAAGRTEMKKMDEKAADVKLSDNKRSRMIAAIRRLDANGDGRLSRSESQKAPGLVRLLDRNRDGEVSADEISAANRDQPQTTPRRETTARPDRKGPQPGPTDRPTSATAAAFFDRLDADGDGKLTRGEVPQRMRENIERIDSNGDRVISREEFVLAVRRQQQRSR